MRTALLLAFLWLALACDRRVEPYVEEEPRQPDLSRIFPAGAEDPPELQRAPSEPPPPPGRPAPGPSPSEVPSGPPIRGTVRVAEGLEARVDPRAVLFIIARPGSAGPPLAVKRVAQPSFPLDFTIGPGDRMIPSIPFAGPLQLTARLDADGNATTRNAGDLQGGASTPVEPGTAGVVVLLDEVL